MARLVLYVFNCLTQCILLKSWCVQEIAQSDSFVLNVIEMRWNHIQLLLIIQVQAPRVSSSQRQETRSLPQEADCPNAENHASTLLQPLLYSELAVSISEYGIAE